MLFLTIGFGATSVGGTVSLLFFSSWTVTSTFEDGFSGGFSQLIEDILNIMVSFWCKMCVV
jgi:hypothetical protein